jgi:acyl-CoA thioester hydrolase
MTTIQPAQQSGHELTLAVRDYECDLQGIVNNSVYQNYLEHARHEFLKSRGIDFAECHARGIDLVVARIRIDYKQALVSGDHCVVRTRVERQDRVKFIFHQEILSLPDRKLAARARVTTVCRIDGRLGVSEELAERLLAAPADAAASAG